MKENSTKGITASAGATRQQQYRTRTAEGRRERTVARRYPRPGIAYRPVSDLPDSTLALAWPQDARSPAVAAFVRAACAVAAAAHERAEPEMQNTIT